MTDEELQSAIGAFLGPNVEVIRSACVEISQVFRVAAHATGASEQIRARCTETSRRFEDVRRAVDEVLALWRPGGAA